MREAKEVLEAMKDSVKRSVLSLPPVEIGGRKLEFKDVTFEDHDPKIFFNYEKHKHAKLNNKTFGIGIYANAKVTDNGKSAVEKVKIGNLPVPTSTGEFIVDGNSYSIDYQFRLKPGAYLRKKQNGEIETYINSNGFPNARVTVDPKTLGLTFGIGQANINALAFLHALGVSQSEQERLLGSDIYKTNLEKLNLDKELSKLEQSIFKGEKLSREELESKLKDRLITAKLDPKTTQITLGKQFHTLNADAIKTIIKKTIDGSKGLVEPDERDAMAFKHVLGVDDFLEERLTGNNQRALEWQIKNLLVKDKPIKDVINSSLLDNRFIKPLFTSSAISEFSSRTNQLQQLGAFRKVTSTGEGGIMNEQAITTDMQAVHPTQAFFVDPLNTPESQKAGIAVQFAHHVNIKNHEAVSPFLNVKTGKQENKSAIDLFNEHVLLPGQSAPDGSVAAIHKGRQIQVKPSQITFKPIHIHQAFSEGSLIAPALNYNQGSRASMRTRHAAQAVSLLEREAPLVQSVHPDGGTYEEKVGKEAMAIVAPYNLTFKKMDGDRLVFKTDDGDEKSIYHWNHDLGTNKSFIHHDVSHLTPGMKFKKGEVIADSNFTKNGTLALGKNMKVAYMPWHGLNFEDGIVVSETGAQKLTSQHMYQNDFDINHGITKMSKQAYIAMFPGKYTKEQLDKLDDNGVVKHGAILNPGDPIHLKIDKHTGTKEDAILGKLHKSLIKPYKDHSETWTQVTPGKVVDSVLGKTYGKINIVYHAPAQVGDKLANRHGAKGVISAIVPDNEMPHNKEGEHTEVIISPMSIISRMSMGQMLETSASKIAKKTGEPYKIGSFDNVDYVDKIKTDLKKHNLSDTEELFDPKSGHSYGKIFTGYPVMQKLFKLSHGNLAARELGAYDSDHQPIRGGDDGSKAIDALTLYGLLAHGHRNILNEISTIKGDYNPDFWQRLQMGLPLPKPQTPFVYKKFEGLLAASGINVRQDGSKKFLAPFTDKDVDKVAGDNKLHNFGMLNYNMEPVHGGLFDTQITGGTKGTKWAKFELPHPIPNPLFETAIKNITGLDDKTYKGLLNHTVKINDKTGHEAFTHILDSINLKQEIEATTNKISTSTKTGKDKLLKKLKLLKSLDVLKMKPSEAYMMSKIPVVPPQFRPVIQLPNGSLTKSSLNILYRDTGLISEAIKENGIDGELYSNLYQSVGAIQGVEDPVSPQAQRQNVKGAIRIITGSTPKTGFFQSKVIRKQQDLSARATIALDNNLHMDQISIPVDIAKSIYKPFATRQLVNQGYDLKEAHKHIDDWTQIGKVAISNEMNQRPIFMNRAPSLHRFSIMAFKPTVNTTDSTVLLPGLIVKPFGADFDGDTVMLHVPVTEDARKEAIKMLPSNNLFNAKAMDLNYVPDQESVMGLHLLSSTPNGRKFINSILPKSVTPVKDTLKKSEIYSRLNELAQKHPQQYDTIATKLKEEGDKFATMAGFSVALDDMKAFNNNIVKAVYSKAMKAPGNKLQNLLQADAVVKSKSTEDKNNNFVKMVSSESKGNKENLKQILYAPGIMKDHNDQPILRPVLSNYGSGTDFADFWTAGYGARKGTLDRQMATARPGALNKEIVNTSMAITVSQNDCGTHHGIPMKADDPHVIGRVDAASGKVITREILKGKKEIIVRSPLTCESVHGVCRKCYGFDEFGSLPTIGRNVGIVSAQAMSEPLTQAAMKTFHLGGTVSGGGGAFGGFENIEQFLQAPKTFRHQAILAEQDGVISNIKPGAAGGYHITIGDKEHFVHPDASQQLLIKKGQKVKKGELLNIGIPHPVKAIDLLGPVHGGALVVDTLHDLYKASDIKINRRNLETVVRGLTGFAKITDAGTSKDHVEGDVVSLSRAMEFNQKANKPTTIQTQDAHGMILSKPIAGLKAGTMLDLHHIDDLTKAGHSNVTAHHAPLKFDRIYVGTDKAPNKSTDWLGSLSFRYLKRGLETGAMHNHMSDVHGYHPMAPFVTGELQYHPDGTY